MAAGAQSRRAFGRRWVRGSRNLSQVFYFPSCPPIPAARYSSATPRPPSPSPPPAPTPARQAGRGAARRICDALPPAPNSLAVLAFANLSDDKENEYFSDGISEKLLNVLAKVPGLRAAARTSAFYFKGKNATAQEMGEKLSGGGGVLPLLDGGSTRCMLALRGIRRYPRRRRLRRVFSIAIGKRNCQSRLEQCASSLLGQRELIECLQLFDLFSETDLTIG